MKSSTIRCAVAAGLALVLGCSTAERTEPVKPLTRAQAEAAYERLAALLPESVGSFTATDGPRDGTDLHDSSVRASRAYQSGGRELEVDLNTGNIRSLRSIVEEDADHAFGSDTPTYWRTVSVGGHRARVAEERNARTSSEVYVAVGERVVLRLRVAPRIAEGESASLAALLDLAAIAEAGI